MHMGVNRHWISSMVDMGATHNFVAEKIVTTLDLSVIRHLSHIKIVNFQTLVVWGMAYGVQVSIENLDKKRGLMVVPLDNFNLILGNDLFVVTKVAISPHLFELLICDQKMTFFITGCNIPFNVEVREQKVEVVFAL